MAIDFKESARKANNESRIMEGREVAEIETLALAYPDGLTIIAAELAQARDKKTDELKTFCRVVFKEEQEKFVNGGSALTKIVQKWFDDGKYEDCEALSADLAACGGVKIKAKRTKLDNGNPYTAITIV